MIISASRRTDIPAFYADWFFNRIKAGFVLTKNPMNPRQVSQVSLKKEHVDCIVFWTKNPGPMLDRLQELKDFNFYFQFTLTAYDQGLESSVPRKSSLLETFTKLSDIIGPERVIWRYDPILLRPGLDLDYHRKWFEELATRIGYHTRKCVVSFLDLYPKLESSLNGLQVRSPRKDETTALLRDLVTIASSWGISIETCSENGDFASVGVNPGKCIDDKLIGKLLGSSTTLPKDKYQRESCGCVPSVDIGTYNTCLHGCRYCYATKDHDAARKNFENHSPNSPFLVGNSLENDEIRHRSVDLLFKK